MCGRTKTRKKVKPSSKPNALPTHPVSSHLDSFNPRFRLFWASEEIIEEQRLHTAGLSRKVADRQLETARPPDSPKSTRPGKQVLGQEPRPPYGPCESCLFRSQLPTAATFCLPEGGFGAASHKQGLRLVLNEGFDATHGIPASD